MTVTAVEYLADHVRRVAELRNLAQDQADALAGKRRAFDLDNAALIADVKAAAQAVDAAEDALRSLALAHYADTSERKPTPGVEIKITEAIEYDAEQALALMLPKNIAVTHTLDRKAFAAVAPTLPAADKTAIRYREVTQPKAYIGRDLNTALGL